MSQKQNGFIGIKRKVNPSDAVNITNIINANTDAHINYQPSYRIDDVLEKIEEQPPHMVVNKSLLNILVTDDMLENAYKTGYIIYEKVDSEDLNNIIDRMTMTAHQTYDSLHSEHVYADEDSYDIKMTSTSIKMEWNSICHNASFTLDHLKKYKDKISPEYLIHSPAFLIHTSKHELKKSDNILTLDSLKNLKKRFPKIVTTIRLAPDWFDSETKDELYSWYVLPRMINYGSKFSDKIYKMYKDKLIEFFGHYLADSLYDISVGHKVELVLSSIPEMIFRPIFKILNKRLQKHYIHTYLKKHFITDEFMEELIEIYGIDYCTLLSQTQVPSLKFMEKYERAMKPILVLKNMVKNNRVIDTYIEKYIDELLAYDSVRHEFFKKSDGFNTEGLNFSEALFTSNKVDSRFVQQNQEYSVDLLQAINMLTDNKMYKKLYTMVRTHKPESDLISSLQQELESMLSQSKKLNDKFNTFKKEY